MQFNDGSPVSLALFLAVVAAVLIMIVYGARKIGPDLARKVGLFIAVWVIVMSAIVLTGIVREKYQIAMPIMIASIILSAAVFAFSSWGKALTDLPLWQLALFQGFRLPLEIVLHLWAGSDTVPPTMTWTGQNFDILTGILALITLVPAARTRTYIWVVNFCGGLLLLNVLRVVVMSSPLPFSWQLEQPLILAFYMPYAMIAFVCVWAAIAGHIILTRALLKSRQ